MKRLFIILLAAAVLNSAFGQDKQTNQISVTGKAEILVRADRAVFSVNVTGFGSTLRGAVEQAKNKAVEISRKLLNLGLKESSLATSYFYSGENFGGKAFLSSAKDFKASITVNITIDTLQVLEEAILRLSESDIENISNITFNLKNFEEVKKKARLQAAEIAKEKASQLADRLNVKLGNLKNCEEADGSFPIYPSAPNPFNTSMAIQANDSFGRSGFYTQNVSITGSIRLIYEIAPAK